MPLARTTLLAAVLLAACARADRAQDPYAAMVADAVPKIEKATGLRFKQRPAYQARTREEMRQFLEKLFNEEKPARDLAAQQTLLRMLGVIADSTDLRTLMLDLYTEQVAGLYDPRTKTLYIVKGSDPAMLDFTVQHELVHALQDQYMNLDSLENIKGDDDRSLAAAAVIEGQATLVPLQAALGQAAEFPSGWDRVRELIRENQSSMPVMARTPEFLQELLIFPYVNGAGFVRRFQMERPGRMPFGDELPSSTAQIMHPREFFDTPRAMPLHVTLPAPRAGAVTYDNVMGEFATYLMLYERLHDQNAATVAADGWAGDRYALVHTPAGDGVAWLLICRSTVDAAELAQALDSVAAGRYAGGIAKRSGTTTTVTARARTITVWGGDVDGRHAVLYEDLPALARSDVFDLGKVRLN